MFDICEELGLKKYVIFLTVATSLGFALHLAELDKTIEGGYRDYLKPIHVSGCVPFHGRDLLDPLQDSKDESY